MFSFLRRWIFFVSLGIGVGFFTLFLHPHMSSLGIEFLRAHSRDAFTTLDIPFPYSFSPQEQRSEAQKATTYALQKPANFWDVNRYHFFKAYSEIQKDSKKWLYFLLYKWGLFWSPIEINHFSSLSQWKLYSYGISVLSFLALISLFFLFKNSFAQFSLGWIFLYFVFYSTSSFRLFLIPLYSVLTILLIKKLVSLILKNQWLFLSFLFPLALISFLSISIPYHLPLSFSVKSLNRIHRANGFLSEGHSYLSQQKKYRALTSFQEGLKAWPYHSTLRVEIAKIYLSDQEFGKALGMLKNPRNNPSAYELLATIFTQYAKNYQMTKKDFSKKAHQRAIENLKKAMELRPFENYRESFSSIF